MVTESNVRVFICKNSFIWSIDDTGRSNFPADIEIAGDKVLVLGHDAGTAERAIEDEYQLHPSLTSLALAIEHHQVPRMDSRRSRIGDLTSCSIHFPMRAHPPRPGIDACDCKGIIEDCGACDGACHTLSKPKSCKTVDARFDRSYFEKKLKMLMAGIDTSSPSDLARELARLSVAAESSVISEQEFTNLQWIAGPPPDGSIELWWLAMADTHEGELIEWENLCIWVDKLGWCITHNLDGAIHHGPVKGTILAHCQFKVPSFEGHHT